MPATEISTRVTETLQRLGIEFRVLPHSKPVFTCEEAASERGVPLAEMVKCMVFIDKGSRRVLLACVPADKRVALNRLKHAANMKSFAAASVEEIAEATGFERGSIAPIGLPESITVIADAALLRKKKVNISSGLPTAGVELSAWDFRKAVGGTFAQITE